MKTNKLIDEVGYMLTNETKADKRLNPIDKNVLALLQFFGDVKILKYNKGGWFPVSIKSNPKLKSMTLEDVLTDAGATATYTTIFRSIRKLVSLGYIEYKTGYWNYNTFKGQLPYFHILKGTNQHLIDNSSCFEDANNTISASNEDIATAIYSNESQNDGKDNVTNTNTMNSNDIATAIYNDIESKNAENNLTTSIIESCSDIAITKEMEKDINNNLELEVYTLSEGTNIAPDPENDFDMFDFLADATDTGEADTYTYTNDETEQYAYKMAQDTMNNTPMATTATPTPTPKPNKKRYWESWKAFKVAMPTLPKDKAKEHFDTYYTKLGVLYTGDELAKHRQGITEDYERIMNKANNNNSNYTNGSKFQLPDDMRIDIMPLRAMGYTNREILATYSQMAGENIRLADELPNRKNYVPQYVRYYFNEMRQIIATMISDGYTDADLTDIAKSYWVDSVLERYQPENFK